MRKEEKDFARQIRAQQGGTELDAMLQYRQMKKTNTPYTRGIVNDTIDGLSQGKARNYLEDE
jgi:hypothetical protein